MQFFAKSKLNYCDFVVLQSLLLRHSQYLINLINNAVKHL